MAYQMATTPVNLSDFEGHSQVAGLIKCNPSNICAVFYTISTDSVLARSLAEVLVEIWCLRGFWDAQTQLLTHSLPRSRTDRPEYNVPPVPFFPRWRGIKRQNKNR